MKAKIKSRKGLTLVELMVAIAAGIIVVLATGMVVFLGQTSWNDSWRKVNLQRDASYAMLKISQSVKSATAASVDAEGEVLTITQGISTITFSYLDASGDLECDVDGNTETVIDGKVGDLQFSVEGNKVIIDLTLEEGEAQASFASTVMMRNLGG